MSNCVHDNGEYCEVLSDKEVRQPCLETPLCEEYKAIVQCKDCIWWSHFISGHDKVEKEWWTCGRYEPIEPDDGAVMTEDDFCSKGERKDD